MNLVRFFSLALLALLSGCSSDDDGSSSSGGSGSSAKKAGDSCTCENKGGGGPSMLAACSGTAGACSTFALSCQLSAPIGPGETGQGTCVQTCKSAEENTQGSCPSGTTCRADGTGGLICK